MAKQVEYIEVTGSQYIDSGFKPNGNTTIEIEVILNSTVTGNSPIFGSRTSTSGTDSTSFTLWAISGTNIRFDHFGSSNSVNTYSPKEKHKYKITPTAEFIDDTQVKTHSQASGSSSCPTNLILGGLTTNGTITYGNCKIYGCKIYDNGTLVKNFVPFKDDSKKFCLKDLVNNKFYYSSTSTELSGPTSIEKGAILNYPYTGKVQTVTLPKGTYKLEVWGAQGGYRSSSSYGGKGGYSVGTLTLKSKTTVYVYAGGAGNTGKTSGGFNGGGSRGTYNGGGGGSDIRLRKDSLYARVIVAGGGGSDGSSSNKGGYGGGDTGQAPSNGYGTAGGGGTQTAGGSGGSGNPGSFGAGGKGTYYASGYAGAGGGGWYGGGGSYPDGSGDDDKGGAGGSGYIYTSSTKGNYPSGCLLTADDYLASASMKNGGTSFTSPTGSSETGHAGDGYCRITVIDCQVCPNLKIKVGGSIKTASAMYIKVNGSWKQITSAYTKVNGSWKSL